MRDGKEQRGEGSTRAALRRVYMRADIEAGDSQQQPLRRGDAGGLIRSAWGARDADAGADFMRASQAAFLSEEARGATDLFYSYERMRGPCVR